MENYRFLPMFRGETANAVKRISDNTFIPLQPDNRDCIIFVAQWRDGASVVRDDGEPVLYTDEAVRALGLDPAIADDPMFSLRGD